MSHCRDSTGKLTMGEAAPTSSAMLGGAAPSLSTAAPAGAPAALAAPAPANGAPPAPAPFGGDLPLPHGIVKSDALFLDAAPASGPDAAGATSTQPQALGSPPVDLPLPLGVVQSDELFAEESQDAPAIDANPGVTAAQLETHLVGTAGVDPVIAHFYTGRLAKALAQPAPTQAQLDTGRREAEAAMRDQYGDDADQVAQVARREMMEMARGFPQLPELLERTGLGNDMSVIRAFAGRAYDKWLAASGLPPR